MFRIASVAVAGLLCFALVAPLSAQTVYYSYSPVITNPAPVITYSPAPTVAYYPSTTVVASTPAPVITYRPVSPVVTYRPVAPVVTYRPVYTGYAPVWYPVRRGLFGRRIEYRVGYAPYAY